MQLLYNDAAVAIGLTYFFLPFTILPLYSVFEEFDWQPVEAAHDLGATRRCAPTRVVLPIVMPGIAAGSLLVFIPCLGARPGTVIDARTGPGAPASIEGYADEAIALPILLAAIRDAEARGADAHVIACFDDPGLSAAREVAAAPVIGICQTAVQVATTLSGRFSIITTLPRSVPVIKDLVAVYGASARCRRVRAVDLPVLSLEADPTTARARLLAEAKAARDVDGAEAIVLGCAGMADLCRWLTDQTGLPAIDGVSAAVRLAEALAGGGYRTSKAGAYAFPRDKSGDATCPARD